MWLGDLSKLKKNSPINIIGAGISGLLLGHYLLKAKIPFTIWEQSSRAGGKLESYTTPFGLVEKSANAIMMNSYVYQLLQDLNLNALYPKPKLFRWVDFNNQWFSHKKLTLQILSALFVRGLKKPPGQVDQTLENFFTPLMGKWWSKNILSAITRGIFAKNSNELTLDALFPKKFLILNRYQSYFSFFYHFIKFRKMNALKTDHKPKLGSISFDHGMQDLVFALQKELSSFLKLNTSLDTIKKIIGDESCVFCTTPPQTATLLKNESQDLAAHFQQIPMLNVQSTTIFTNEAFSKLLNSFGVLFTPENSMPFYGILAQSEIFDHRVTKNHYHCYTVIGPQISAIDIEKNFLNYSGLKQENILAIFPHSWDKALPIYNYDRQLAVEKIEHYLNSLHKPWLFFGNYIEAIGLKNLVQGAYTLAENLRQN